MRFRDFYYHTSHDSQLELKTWFWNNGRKQRKITQLKSSLANKKKPKIEVSKVTAIMESNWKRGMRGAQFRAGIRIKEEGTKKFPLGKGQGAAVM